MERAEQETVINFDEESEFASVYTFNGGLKRKLEKYSADFPELCRLVKDYGRGAVEYEVDKGRLSINFKKPYTEEQKERKRVNNNLHKS